MAQVVLNEKLMTANKVDETARNKLHAVYTKELTPLMDLELSQVEDMPEYVKKVEKLEYKLQGLWNFPLDRNYHTYWFKDKKCKCPILDQFENIGTEFRIINESCPLHGGKHDK